ncbi:MAG: ATP-binding protein [Planctomycetaceae bacterium]|nr:ATP-binding protein [Planctomycetaceae bacterium]
MFDHLGISEVYILIAIVLLSLGAMVSFTHWLVRCRSTPAFLIVVWVGYAIITVTGGSTVLHALQKERHHWARFFLSTCQLFGSLVQSEAHDKIEFSYSLWSEPFHPEGLSFGGEQPQPDPQYSTRPLDIPQQIRWIKTAAFTEAPFLILDWRGTPNASEYEVAWLAHPDCEEGWVPVYQGAETSFVIEEPGWFRVRSLRITSMNDPIYERISQILVDTAMSIPDIGSVYTMRDYSDKEYVFIVCPKMDANKDEYIDPETERLAPIGEPYPREEFAEIPPGVRTPVITDFPTVDEWGTWYSASIALYRPDGTREGYVAVDYPVATWEQNVLQTQITYSIFLVVVLAMYFFGIVQVTKLHITSEGQRVTANDMRLTVGELTEAKKLAETAARAKSYFLSNMSHEIRTPMNAVLGFASILGQRLMACCPPEQRDDNLLTINLIEKSSSDLLTIIGDILDFSKVDEGRVEIKWVPTKPRQIMEDVYNVIHPRLREKPHITFDCVIDEAVPQWMYSDPTRLRQILGNICGNAVKFSDKGTIRFSCRQMVVANTPENITSIRADYGQSLDLDIFEKDEQIVLLQFSVRDEGVGIPEQELPTLFQPFTQGDASLTRKFGGTGLGLSIARQLTRLMGGDIAVQSRENEGSIFSITFVVSEKHRQLGSTMGFSGIVLLNDFEHPLAGRNILVVEDGKVNQIVITKMLQDAGARVDTAENGEVALEKIGKSEEAFDVVLMDMQMPVMDGYEATQRLRQSGFAKPIIAVTAHALTGDIEKTLQVGCDAYISKPVDKNKLIDEILKLDEAAFLLG